MANGKLLIEVKDGKPTVELSGNVMDIVNSAVIGDPRLGALFKIAVATYFRYQDIPLTEMQREMEELYFHEKTRKPPNIKCSLKIENVNEVAHSSQTGEIGDVLNMVLSASLANPGIQAIIIMTAVAWFKANNIPADEMLKQMNKVYHQSAVKTF